MRTGQIIRAADRLGRIVQFTNVDGRRIVVVRHPQPMGVHGYEPHEIEEYGGFGLPPRPQLAQVALEDDGLDF